MNKHTFLEKLSENKPSFYKLYNYDFLPETFKSADKITITCKKHGDFVQNVASHLYGQGCPKCGRATTAEKRTLTTDYFIKKSMNKFGTKFGYEKTNYTKKGHDLEITCPSHGDITIRPEAHMWSNYGCPKCDYEIPREISKRKFLEKAKNIHNDKYNYGKVEYINSNNSVEIICPDHGSFWQGLYTHTARKNGCPKCARESNKFSQEQFIKESKIVHGDNYDYSKVKYLTNTSMVIITCKKHGDFLQRAASHLVGNKCKKCFSEESKKSTEEFIKESLLVHGDNYDYSKVKYQGNKIPVEIICKTHGSFWQKPNSHISSANGCRFCSESKGERSIELFLKKYNFDYIREYRLLPHLYRCDFYLPEFNIYIEFNGIQHYKPVEIFDGLTGHLKTKENDIIKKKLIEQNKGNLITITYLFLNEKSVEKELIRQFKNIYKHWFVVDGKKQVFKEILSIYDFFKIPLSVKLKDLISKLHEVVKNFSILF